MTVKQTKKMKMGKLNLSKKRKKTQKVLNVDVTQASLTHAMKKLKYFKGVFFFYISLLVCHGKLVPLHNLVKSEFFYLLEIWRYEQNKGAERP